MALRIDRSAAAVSIRQSQKYGKTKEEARQELEEKDCSSIPKDRTRASQARVPRSY
ncbi:MAG: hypothetical protein K0S91_3240 [Nitrososphaeraceae archaeon]|nr:hypothetical protein [Nitrososphaeraceae archaeon]